MSYLDIISRNNVRIIGTGKRVIMLAHGFGCNQQMWKLLLAELDNEYKLVLFDYVGSGATDLTAFTKEKYQNLSGYAQDIIDICGALALEDVYLVGHSVSGMISLLAAQKIPEQIAGMVMVCPSPCFLNKPPDYAGGFEEEDLKELMDLMDKNYIGWAQYLAPLVTGELDGNAITAEISESFCSTNPVTAKTFAKATFFSDHRPLLPLNKHPVLLLQSENDALASQDVGEYMFKNMPESILQVIPAKGHCLHMTHPKIVAEAIKNFVA